MSTLPFATASWHYQLCVDNNNITFEQKCASIYQGRCYKLSGNIPKKIEVSLCNVALHLFSSHKRFITALDKMWGKNHRNIAGCTTSRHHEVSTPYHLVWSNEGKRGKDSKILFNLVTLNPELMFSLRCALIPQHIFLEQKNEKLIRNHI